MASTASSTQKRGKASNGGDTASTPTGEHLNKAALSMPAEGASEFAQTVGLKNMAELRAEGGIRGIASKLSSDLETGIPAHSHASRQARYGVNALPPVEKQTFMDFVKETLEDRTMQILIGAAVVSLILGLTTPDPRTGEIDRATGWVEGAAILLSVVIVTLVSAVNNFQKQEQFAVLSNAETTASLCVVRDGDVVEVGQEDVVVGDIALVQAGMALSFDALLVAGTGYTSNESSITGENDDVHKSPDMDPFLLSGTHIVDGCDGRALVVAVGPLSFAGAIAMSTRQSKTDTPLTEQLESMADAIGKFGLAAAVFTFVALLIKEIYTIVFGGGRFFAMKLFENITTAVAIVVVAVPEGLPLSVTLSLAYSMKQMLADNNLVRHLAACETMGGATVILTDKTGTLTNNDMKVVSVFIDGEHVRADKVTGFTTQAQGARSKVLKLFADCVAFNYPTGFGQNKTAHALQHLATALQHGDGYDADATVRTTAKDCVQRFAFSSQRKRSSAVVNAKTEGAGQTLRHYVIGAGELVFQKCTSCLVDGKRSAFSVDAKQRYESAINEYSQSGYRTLCVAYSERNGEWAELPHVPPEDPLTVLGVVAIEEPLRSEVPAAIAACQGAGIQVVMVTGDSMATATNIAQRCGIMGPGKTALEGTQFRASPDSAIDARSFAVLARATPLDKKRLVEMYRRDPAAVVAVTGDGTNDAPALKAADVGFAMNTGSDIAKQASDIVLLNDNFAGVVKAVVWGRNVRDNIRKFLQFQLTVNAVACIVAFLGAVINSQNLSPLKPVQLLWLNLIMDTFAALALATELPSEKQLLARDPDPRNSSIISAEMAHAITAQVAFQLVTELLLLSLGHHLIGSAYFDDRHLTVVFNAFVLMQVFNFFNARLLRSSDAVHQNLGKSTGMLYIVFLIVVTQFVIVQKGGKFMSTVPLDATEWLLCTGIASASLPVGAVARATRSAGSSNAVLRTLTTVVNVVLRK